MNKSIRISAVIPTFNRKKTITRAIDSIIAQEYSAYEIIIVDDGSNDNTKEIIKSYRDKIRYFYQKNSGVATARNFGVYIANSEWIAFLDSDDYWLPGYLKRMADVMNITGQKAALYFSDVKRPIEKGMNTYWELCEFSIPTTYELRHNASEWAFWRTQPMMIQASVIRREAYLGKGGIPNSLITREDTFLFYKLCLFYPVCAVSGCGAVVSSDGKRSERLTVKYDGYSSTYHECTKLLYRELLRYCNDMSEDQQKAIKKSYVEAQLGFSRILVKKKKFFYAIVNMAILLGINPILLARKVIYILRSFYSNRQ
jgi:glycosyltransferase involved in cell wall biosynthesis